MQGPEGTSLPRGCRCMTRSPFLPPPPAASLPHGCGHGHPQPTWRCTEPWSPSQPSTPLPSPSLLLPTHAQARFAAAALLPCPRTAQLLLGIIGLTRAQLFLRLLCSSSRRPAPRRAPKPLVFLQGEVGTGHKQERNSARHLHHHPQEQGRMLQGTSQHLAHQAQPPLCPIDGV